MVMTSERPQLARGGPVANNDPRPLEGHAYAEGVRVMHGSDGRAYRLCSACGRIRNSPCHRGFTQPTHARLTDDDVHAFAPGGLTRPDARGHELPVCRVCDRPQNSLRHRGPGAAGSTAPGSSPSIPRAGMLPTPEVEARANHGYPLVAPDRHPYVAGTRVQVDKRGAKRVTCATCDQPANSPRHRGLAAAVAVPTPVVAVPSPVKAPDRHPYRPGDAVVFDKRAHRLVLCAECNKPGNAPAHRKPKALALVPSVAPDPVPGPQRTRSVPPAAVAAPGATTHRAPDRIKAPPAELALLAIAIDTVLALPTGSVDTGLWVRLVAIRSTLDVPRLATLAPPPPDVDDDGPEHAPNGAAAGQDGHPIARPVTGPAAATYALRGIRSDKVRSLVKRAVAQGWDASKTGSGHIALDRGDKRVIVSATGSNRGGHWFANVRAEARRAGIDVTGL